MNNRFLRALLSCLIVVVFVVLVGAASASAASPWWHLSSITRPAHIPTAAGVQSTIVVSATNVGDAVANGAAAPIALEDTLPERLKVVGIEGVEQEYGTILTSGPIPCEQPTARTVSCTTSAPLAPFHNIQLRIVVEAEAGAESGANAVAISGGEARPASIARDVVVGGAPASFGVQEYDLQAENEGGAADTQAGSHPFQLTTTLYLNQTGNFGELPAGKAIQPVGLAKDLQFKLPPGLIGNPTTLSQCPLVQFLNYGEGGLSNQCPQQTAIGAAVIDFSLPNTIGNTTLTMPVFNLEPEVGEPARFGFVVDGVPVFLDTAVRTGGDYGVTVDIQNLTQTAGFLSSEVTLWGVPDSPQHHISRGYGCLYQSGGTEPERLEELEVSCQQETNRRPTPFLSLPTACTGPLQTTVEADQWKEPGRFTAASPLEPELGLGGCNRLPFEPSVKVTPDGQAGSTPTGLTVDEHVSQASTLDGEGLAESDVKGLSVTLPEGVALNPAAADGLQACSLGQVELQGAAAGQCPEASKIATVKIKTPLLKEPLEGYAYLAAQDANPFGSLVAMYVEAFNPIEGVRVKAAGEVLENPATGQLTAHFEGDPVFENDPQYAGDVEAQFLPELAFEDVELHFFGGDRAPLATPAKCGGYTTTGTFTPWSGNATRESSSEFQVTSGPNGSPCANPLPFAPTLTTGTTSIQAGGFTPFETTMSREDGSQNLQGIQLHMPPGMSGTLSTVKLCGEAQADAGTCGPESQIGETTVSVGVGGDPYTVTGGKVYITGPYKGAPFGLSIVNPAKAGPFDLGEVIVRAKIEVNPLTAALTITTDNEGPYRIPTLIDGIPLQIRHVNVNVNRPGFTFNATNCHPLAVTGTLTSTEGATSNLSVPYQVTNCATLKFQPKFTASTSGKTTRARGASLSVKLTYPNTPQGTEANIAKVKVDLPKQLPSRLKPTLQSACLAKVFEANPAGCPKDSVVGTAKAITPILPVPLEGPAYFVSHGGEAFPSLIVVLQGYGVTVDLVGTTFISKAGITSSTFKSVPDVPVGSFELNLPEGPHSALAVNLPEKDHGNFCGQKLAMPTAFVSQTGQELHQSTPISVSGCSKAKKSSKKKKHAKAKKRKK